MNGSRLVLLMLVGLTGCNVGEFLDFSSRDEADLPEYLFEIEYVNFAWGRQWRGLYMDGGGGVYRYDLEGADWQPPSPWSEFFTRAELTKKYSYGRERVGEVPEGELSERYGLVEAAGRGPLSDPKGLCKDFGTVTFRAYLYDEPSERYRPVVLYQYGDTGQINRSSAARSLVEWLARLDRHENPDHCKP